MKTVAVVHPSRQRPEMARKTLNNLFSEMELDTRVRYVLSLDMDDIRLDDYLEMFMLEREDYDFGECPYGEGVMESYRDKTSGLDLVALISANNNIVEATNRAYCPQFVDNVDYTMIHSDDMRLSRGWNLEIEKVFDEHGYDKLVKTLQPGQEQPDLVSFQIAGRDFWKAYGHFFYPGYLSLYGDNDVTEYAKLNGKWVDARHLVFPHLHFSIDLPQEIKEKFGESLRLDQTYEREAQQDNIRVGIETFKRRMANGFTE